MSRSVGGAQPTCVFPTLSNLVPTLNTLAFGRLVPLRATPDGEQHDAAPVVVKSEAPMLYRGCVSAREGALSSLYCKCTHHGTGFKYVNS